MIRVFAPHKASFPDFRSKSWHVLHGEPSGVRNAATRTPEGPLFKPFSSVSGPSPSRHKKWPHRPSKQARCSHSSRDMVRLSPHAAHLLLKTFTMCFPNVHSFTFRFADPFSLSSVQLSDSQNIPHILLFFVILLFVLYPHTFRHDWGS